MARPIEHGHEHHLRAINTIRRAGGIARAVETGLLKSGIMYECVKNGVDFVLAGSIRDDGPLPEVITDTLEAQDRMRASIHDVGFALLIATALHSIATGNLLPARVKVVCVDINPATVTKLSDRGTFQTIGLVTDVEPFLRSLAGELAATSVQMTEEARDRIMERSDRAPDPDVSPRLLRDRVRDQSLDERAEGQRSRALASAMASRSIRRSWSSASRST